MHTPEPDGTRTRSLNVLLVLVDQAPSGCTEHMGSVNLIMSQMPKPEQSKQELRLPSAMVQGRAAADQLAKVAKHSKSTARCHTTSEEPQPQQRKLQSPGCIALTLSWQTAHMSIHLTLTQIRVQKLLQTIRSSTNFSCLPTFPAAASPAAPQGPPPGAWYVGWMACVHGHDQRQLQLDQCWQ